MNYAFYDPELHWCKACNVFPKTAKDYLNHLHSKDHADVVKKATESPWHENNQNVVSYGNTALLLSHFSHPRNKQKAITYVYVSTRYLLIACCAGILKQIITNECII